ncbi:MAG: hypothetical protein Q9216_007231 [Gyalolechia sp. 2 TL-2023]
MARVKRRPSFRTPSSDTDFTISKASAYKISPAELHNPFTDDMLHPLESPPTTKGKKHLLFTFLLVTVSFILAYIAFSIAMYWKREAFAVLEVLGNGPAPGACRKGPYA